MGDSNMCTAQYVLEPGYSGGRRRGAAGQAGFVASCIPRAGGRQVTTLEDYPVPSARHSAMPFLCPAAAPLRWPIVVVGTPPTFIGGYCANDHKRSSEAWWPELPAGLVRLVRRLRYRAAQPPRQRRRQLDSGGRPAAAFGTPRPEKLARTAPARFPGHG